MTLKLIRPSAGPARLEELKQFANMEALDQYWKMIFERHNIWHKRFVLGQPAPWTEDKILLEYKFTNMYRELDRGTIWLADNILGKGTVRDRIWNILIYRMFNRINTQEALGFLEWNKYSNSGLAQDYWEHMEYILRQHAKKEAIYTDAHMVCAYSNIPGKDKLERVIEIFKRIHPHVPELERLCKNATDLSEIWDWLQGHDGYGPFIGYEVAVDFTYDKEITHLDEDHWANAGPGCMRGIDAMFPDRPRGVSYMEVLTALRNGQESEFKRLNLPFESIAYMGKGLTYRNIEHDCCEFFKYWKALKGLGRPRNKFRPVTKEGSALHERLKG